MQFTEHRAREKLEYDMGRGDRWFDLETLYNWQWYSDW